MASLAAGILRMLEEQVRREERTIDTYSRYSSQAGNPALSSMLNEFVVDKARNTDALLSLIGGTGERRDVFEEQVYSRQIGGPNPGGYRDGGTAGTIPLGSRDRGKMPGNNVGFEAAQLEFGWYEPINTHMNNYGRQVIPPSGSIQSTGIARGEAPSGGYMTNAFTGGIQGARNSDATASSRAANEYLPWVTSDDDAIVRDVLAAEREMDVEYASIERFLEKHETQPGYPDSHDRRIAALKLKTLNILRIIRQGGQVRMKRLTMR